MAIKTNISKDQQKELRSALKKLKVPDAIAAELTTSQHGADTYKAFRQGKRLQTKSGWIIHFGAKWAKAADKTPAATRPQEQVREQAPTSQSTIEVPTIDEDMLPDSPQIMVDMPDLGSDKATQQKAPRFAKSEQIMVSFQIDKDQLMEMQKLASKQGVNVNILFKLAIKQFLG